GLLRNRRPANTRSYGSSARIRVIYPKTVIPPQGRIRLLLESLANRQSWRRIASCLVAPGPSSLQLCRVESLFSTARGSPCRSRPNRRPMSLQASAPAEAAHGKLSRLLPFHLTV